MSNIVRESATSDRGDLGTQGSVEQVNESPNSHKVKTVMTFTFADGREETSVFEREHKMPTREQIEKNMARRWAIQETDIAVKVSRFMDLLQEASELGAEIVEEGAEGDSPWHERYVGDSDGYHEGFLADVRATARICHSMREQIHAWERT
jgi:hypothetical protein